MRRILIKGSSGAGKSTLALAISQRLELPHVELDALYWGPNWTAASAEELRERLSATVLDEQGWVVDGNYGSKLGTLVLDRAELVVWLDLPLPTKIWRLLRRTFGRWIRQELLWNGNRESLTGFFWGKHALFGWAVRTHFEHRRRWPGELSGRPLVRLRNGRQVTAWLATLRASGSPPASSER